MSTDPKTPQSPETPDAPRPPKAMPSAAEINAYLELSAARTKLRLPLAKGAASSDAAEARSAAVAPAPPLAKRVLPLSSSTKPPAQREAASADEAPADSQEVWRPFANDDER